MAASWGAQLIGLGTTGGTATGAAIECPGGICTMVVVATWSGGTVKLQMLGPDGTTWVDAGTNTTFTANGNGVAYLSPCMIRGFISGSPTGVFASIARVVS